MLNRYNLHVPDTQVSLSSAPLLIKRRHVPPVIMRAAPCIICCQAAFRALQTSSLSRGNFLHNTESRYIQMSPFDKTIGFIGSGNMAFAIIRGIITTGLVSPDRICISDANPAQVEKVSGVTGAQAAVDNINLVTHSDIIVLATKPYHLTGVLTEVKASLEVSRHLVVSICAGVRTSAIEAAAGEGVHVVRVMPNTPALIGCGSAAISGGRNATNTDLEFVSQIFDSVGTSIPVPEEKLDAVTGLTGSGPAYVFRFIEALMAAAEEQGLTSEEAQVLVPQMVLGATRMAVEGDRTLAELREAVTTPGGTTAAGLKVLDQGHFMALISGCVAAATARSRELASS